MRLLKTLVVHPDSEVRHQLRDLLGELKQIKVLGEALSAFEAMEMLDFIPYDVFIIGVELPNGVSGIELGQMLGKRQQRPVLVYIATDESLAYKAFELGAADYIIWPLDGQRLKLTEERLVRYVPEEEPEVESGSWMPRRFQDDGEEETLHLQLPEEDQDRFLQALRQAWDFSQRQVEIEKLPITEEGRTVLIPYNQIVFIEAYEDYSFVHTSAQKHLTSYRLKNLEDRLRQHGFFRVHRKYLVNLEMVTEIATMPGSNFMLRTAGRKRIELPISRRRISELKQILGL